MSPTTKTLAFSAILLTTLAYLRPPEYDEAYSIFLTANHARPAWPTAIFTPADVQNLYSGHSTFPQIAQNLKTGDVHPPLYFWLLHIWRDAFGPAWLTARLLSVLITLASLATLSRLARLTNIPAIPALLLCLCTYGFAYTAIITRGFALAQFFLILGVTLTFKTRPCERPPRHGGPPTRHGERSEATQESPPKPHRLTPALAGLALGAATFTNYLTLFTALTTLAYLTLKSPKTALTALITFLLFLPEAGKFFLAQHASRPGQFTKVSLPHAIPLLAKDAAAAWFGGLPLYAPNFAPEITAILILLAATTIFYIAKHPTPTTLPLTALTLSTPLGLLALGLIFNNTPIEIRYLSFSLPYLSLLIAASAPKPLQTTLLAIESVAILGLALSPATAQPQSAAAHQAAALATENTLTLLPFGNDGVGIPGPFIAAAPPTMRLEILNQTPPGLATESRLLLVTLALDDSSRAQIAAFHPGPCWRLQTTTPLIRQYLNTCAPHGPPINPGPH